MAAAGGRGGLGNAALASPRRKAPGFALKGVPGQQRDLILELKTVADVGLVGFPNAGKSSIISVMSAARPKIASYPFTTLIPNLGVVEAGDVQFVVADVPGLIPGASQGKGLGHDFLRHVERCSILVHVLDCATEEPGRSPVADLAAIEYELAAYGEATGVDLISRPRLVALNKIDVPAARERADQVKPDLEKRGYQVFEISAATGEGLRPLGFAMAALVAADRAARPAEQPAERVRVKVAVKNVDEPGFEVLRLGEDTFLIRGEKPRRWVQQTDFSNDEAIGYLADRLARLGVEEALAEAGAEAGAEVLIGEPDDAVVFDWDPAAPMSSGARARGPRTARAAPTPGSTRDPQPRLRPDIAAAARVVVKVGSSSLTTAAGGIADDRIGALAAALAARHGAGTQVVLVSSGAIASGLVPLGLTRRPSDLATQQAAASVGQGLLIARYTAAFAEHGIRTGQVLLSADDLMRRTHYRNAQRTLDRLLELGVLPVVNENDTVATDEIRFGDNDRLAALVAHVTHAKALVLLSDVDGVYDGDPRRGAAQRIAEVRGQADLEGIRLGRGLKPGQPASQPARHAARRSPGIGGMATKVEAALIASAAGIPTVVAAAASATAALNGDPVGTYFAAHGRRPATRLLWLRHAAVARGSLRLDPGAVEAVVKRHASLLPAGLTGVDGTFDAGDPVDLRDENDTIIARGLVNYDAAEIPGLMGRSTRWLASKLGPEYEREIVHRDDLVIL